MEQLIVLGTGNAQAIHCYNTCYAMKKGEEYFLVDAGGGNGILSQLDKASIPLEKIHHIFVTHAHNAVSYTHLCISADQSKRI